MQSPPRAPTLVALALLLAAGGAHAQSPAPALVGEGVVSTRHYEGSPTLSPDGASLYFAVRPPVGYLWVICRSRRAGDGWTTPEVVEFSGRHNDLDPFVSPDGRRLFFVTNRTADGRTKADLDIWVAERAGDGWAEPRPVEGAVNSAQDELRPTVDREGTLYFASTRTGSRGVDLYSAAWRGNGYAEPARLDSALNARPVDTQPAISPDGRTLVWVSVGRAEEVLLPGVPYARGDLYVSTRGPGGWSAPRRLPDPVNSPAAELSPAFSADGARLLFASERGFGVVPSPRPVSYRDYVAGLHSVLSGQANVFEVDARFLEVAR